MTLPESPQFSMSEFFPKNIFIFGLGGGGSKTLSELPAFIYESVNLGLCSPRGNNAPTIHLVDFDVVEPQNCVRQLFYPYDVGQLKISALAARYQGLLKINCIPEAANAISLPKILTPEILAEPFCVISKLDRGISTAQIYNYLRANASGSESNWTWFFSGTSLIEQKLEGVFRQLNVEVKSPYVTAYMYGIVNGVPIIPEPSDPDFLEVFPKPLPPHVGQQDIIAPTNGATGVNSEGGGCGMSDADAVEQAGLGNLLSTAATISQMGYFYHKEIVVPKIIYENGAMQSLLPYSLREVLFPEQYPELKNILEQEENV